MKNLLIAASLAVCALTLSGCNDETHDVPYFKAHKDEMANVLTECKKQEMTTWSDNCKNAYEANAQVNNENFLK